MSQISLAGQRKKREGKESLKSLEILPATAKSLCVDEKGKDIECFHSSTYWREFASGRVAAKRSNFSRRNQWLTQIPTNTGAPKHSGKGLPLRFASRP